MLLKDLYYMTQIAGCGSLSRAARQLGITQSALSHAVSRLEREFSVPLLARQTGGVTLTPAGQAMVAEAQTILFHCRTMKETLAGYAQADRRNLKIGITTLHEKYVIPMLVKHYSASYPQTSITFVSAHSDELEEKVLAGALDFCIMPLPVRSPRLAARKLFSEEILLALPASHPFVSQFPPGALTFRELALLENETFIITRKNGKFAGGLPGHLRQSLSPGKLNRDQLPGHAVRADRQEHRRGLHPRHSGPLRRPGQKNRLLPPEGPAGPADLCDRP